MLPYSFTPVPPASEGAVAYQRYLNLVGLAATLPPRIDTPPGSLGVGPAEDLTSRPVPYRVEQAGRPQPALVGYNLEIVESSDDFARGPAVTPEDFPKEGWLGEAI